MAFSNIRHILTQTFMTSIFHAIKMHFLTFKYGLLLHFRNAPETCLDMQKAN